jgi:YegS/Rv2252/BmrU family lipid kinase
MRPLYVISNPAAARGSSARRFQKIRQLLEPHAEFVASKERGHVEALAHEAALAGYATVVAAGGDGTVHEVANGLLRAGRPDVALGVLPLGSGNDYAASLNLPRDPAALCQSLVSGSVRRVDVGLVEDGNGKSRHFVNTLGIGLTGAVVWEVQQIHGLRGMALYGLGALRAIGRHFRASATTLHFDHTPLETATLLLALAIGRREGGGFIVAPNALLDDGLFDYLHGSQLTRLQTLWYLPGLAFGRLPRGDPLVRSGRCTSLALETTEPLMVHCDGEVFAGPSSGPQRLSARILPSALAIRGAA